MTPSPRRITRALQRLTASPPGVDRLALTLTSRNPDGRGQRLFAVATVQVGARTTTITVDAAEVGPTATAGELQLLATQRALALARLLAPAQPTPPTPTPAPPAPAPSPAPAPDPASATPHPATTPDDGLEAAFAYLVGELATATPQRLAALVPVVEAFAAAHPERAEGLQRALAARRRTLAPTAA